jgi:VanZ family protein
VWALLFKLAWFPSQRLTFKNYIVFTAAGLVLAALSELVQLFIPYRSFTMTDLYSNCIGVVIGIPVILLIRTKKSTNTTG